MLFWGVEYPFKLMTSLDRYSQQCFGAILALFLYFEFTTTYLALTEWINNKIHLQEVTVSWINRGIWLNVFDYRQFCRLSCNDIVA